jgi:hypothetical protein
MAGSGRRMKHSGTDAARTADLTARHEAVAMDVALGELSFAATAAKHGVGRTTLWRWLKEETFRARVAELTAMLVEQTEWAGLFDRAHRQLQMQREYDLLREVVAARAEKLTDRDFLLAHLGIPCLPHCAAHTGLYDVGVTGSKGGRTVAQWTLDHRTLERLARLREEAARMQGEPGFAPPGAARFGDDEAASEGGTTYTLTPGGRARMLLDLVKDDPEYAARARELLAD